ncbi:hypothetical protein N7454_006492 [Penicillium verhagenii]|nr:hypothetical protein N7454_006492 [Penicillium verhagenii]
MSETTGVESPESENIHTVLMEPLNQPRQAPDQEELPKDPAVKPKAVLQVLVPAVDNRDDYGYLPGHFAVRKILKLDSENPKNPSYTVRLQSGERETMSYDRFMRLDNSMEALDQFNPDSDSSDDLVVIDRNTKARKRTAFTYGDGAADESDPEFPAARSSRRSSRPTRGRAAAPGQFTDFFRVQTDSEGEEDSDALESSDDELRTSAVPNKKGLRRGMRRIKLRSSDNETSDHERGTRRSKRTTLKKNLRERFENDFSESESEAPRRSNRERRTIRKNMRERLEDDLSEAESRAPRRQKYSGAKESFLELAPDDEFRVSHFECCSTCKRFGNDKEKGILVFCQGCSSSYHQFCLGPRASREHLVTKIDEGNFILQCRRCLGISHERHDIRPHLGNCAVCREAGPMSQPLRQRLTSKEEQRLRVENDGVDPITHIDMNRVNNTRNVLFRCTTCDRGFHIDHLSHINTAHETNATEETDALRGYKHRQCHECSSTAGEIEILVAWRPAASDMNKLEKNKLRLPELVPEMDKEYLIKWKNKSYFRVTWMPGDWVWGVSSPAMMRAFYQRTPREAIFTAKKAIPEANMRIDTVFNVSWMSEDMSPSDEKGPEMVREAYVKYKGLNYEDAVWEAPPRPDETERWEDFKVAFKDWLSRGTIPSLDRKKLKDHLTATRELNFEDLELKVQPKMIVNGKLMDYQLEGVNWLYYKHIRQDNAILADDMGLGKTLQIISLFATLIERHTRWPFLVVAPNSTVPNWRREIKSWAPDIQVATYFGSKYARQMAYELEMFPEGGNEIRCHVVIASYESMVDSEAKRVLSKVHWAGLVVDEAHRLKNDHSQLYERLARMKFDHKVLLTGTPLQNNIRELFNLIQFLDPKRNAEQLEEEYSDLTSDNIRALHKLISPVFLRRTKTEVLPFLPPMVQIIVPVSMSFVQKKLYKSILGKNPQLIKAICTTHTSQIKKQERLNLNNVLMQLRKCLCHPFVYNREIEEITSDPILAHQRLVEASGKFELLSLMLPKLRERGHRVLIFSQFLENLDLVEDFLSGMKLLYCRLDGQLVAREKQQQIDLFNAPDSPYFAFLLSTRSGGVGINLATADTVIIMDPDFNPKQDMQALSRAHRIGQKNNVLVYHLTTRASVEEKIMERGKKKLTLDHVLIERMEDEEDEEDLESILRHGAQALFNDDHSADIHYDSASIDKLLDRSQAEKADEMKRSDQGDKDAKNHQANPQFNFARVWQKDAGTLEEVTVSEDAPIDENLWAKILDAREIQARDEELLNAETLGRGKRKRAQVNYQAVTEEAQDLDGTTSNQASPVKKRKSKASGDSDVEFQGKGSDEEIDSADDSIGEDDRMDIDPLLPKYTRPFKRVHVPEEPPLSLGLDGSSDSMASCLACEKRHELGHCPLKGAGVEHCPLCGLAHLGGRRACPNFNSKSQLQLMLQALSQSNEDPSLVNAAKLYLRGVIGHLTHTERKKSANAKENGLSSKSPSLAADLSRSTSNLSCSDPRLALPQLGSFTHQTPKTSQQQADLSTLGTRANGLETTLVQPLHGSSAQEHPAHTTSPILQQPMPLSQSTLVPRPLTSDAQIVDLTGPDELDETPYRSPYPHSASHGHC